MSRELWFAGVAGDSIEQLKAAANGEQDDGVPGRWRARGGNGGSPLGSIDIKNYPNNLKRVVAGYHAASKLPPPAAKASFGGRTCGGADAPGAGGLWCYGGGGSGMVAGGGKKDGGGRRVMVVADGRAEATGALQWALSQAVRCNDAVLLLAVVRPATASAGEDGGESYCVNISRTRCYQQLDAMRCMCESARPEVKVEVCVVEAAGRERAPALVEAARRHGASLLVLGQRRRRPVARWLLALWPPAAAAKNKWRRRGGKRTVEYCIEHAPCVALGVRRRSSGGYLVSSKRHKDFWLLA
ncbi:hypothetical protein E2562_017002 [Oryza meyeriana var. granulata]|uniref:UspA domain-containing protein n=1 Tax=Oryza meyeriana var. granulata TaxID=110450 RepID=A0A6G1EBD3_9ORYZ|nr:hypothetical protein E2562_017002 [Oryza meyeriana var. granulata]